LYHDFTGNKGEGRRFFAIPWTFEKDSERERAGVLTISSDTAQARDVDRQRFSGIEYFVPISDVIGATGNPLAVSDDKTADGLLHILGGGPVQQGNGAGEALRNEKVVTMRGE
jgi:hypothetical protein